MFVSFLTVPAVPTCEISETESTPALPAFKSRWWHRADRLDARPVIWSLYNRPEDWSADHDGYTIRHNPSKHRFWIANGWGHYALYEADCSCMQTRGRFQRFQQSAFGRAQKHWHRNHHRRHDPEHFAAHFVR